MLMARATGVVKDSLTACASLVCNLVPDVGRRSFTIGSIPIGVIYVV